jgi:hypothetical protein
MNARSTLLLGAVAVVVLAAGLYLGTGQRDDSATSTGRAAFPGLVEKLAGAEAIDVQRDGKTLHATRAGDNWTLPDKGGFAAQPGYIHALLTGLAGLKLVEPRTADPAEYGKLGLDDPPKEASKDAGDKAGALVRVLGKDGAKLAEIVLGHGRSADQLYVRIPGEAQTWLADGNATATADPKDWIDATIADIQADKIATVTVTHGAETLSFAREGGAFTLKTPAEHPKLDDAKVAELTHALENLTLEDVKPAPAPGTPDGQAVFTTTDGESITVTLGKDGDSIWATIEASGADKAKDAADALQARVKGFAFRLGKWREGALAPTLDQLKAPPPPAPAAAPPPAPAPAPAQ